MTRVFFNIGKFLVFSRRHKNVRRGFITLCTNLLILSAVVLMLEIALILMGTGDVFLPITNATRTFLTRLFF